MTLSRVLVCSILGLNLESMQLHLEIFVRCFYCLPFNIWSMKLLLQTFSDVWKPYLRCLLTGEMALRLSWAKKRWSALSNSLNWVFPGSPRNLWWVQWQGVEPRGRQEGTLGSVEPDEVSGSLLKWRTDSLCRNWSHSFAPGLRN